MTIKLEIVGPYGPDGWIDPETGVEHYNSDVQTPWGILGKLQTTGAGTPVILRADGVILVRRDLSKFKLPGVSVRCGSYGDHFLQISGTNGEVEYQLFNDDLEFVGDTDFPVATYQLAKLHWQRWKPVAEAPADERHEVTTKQLKLAVRREKM